MTAPIDWDEDAPAPHPRAVRVCQVPGCTPPCPHILRTHPYTGRHIMTRKTKYLGRDPGGRSSADRIAPSKPYTGDGKTTRNIHDKPTVEFVADPPKHLNPKKK